MRSLVRIGWDADNPAFRQMPVSDNITLSEIARHLVAITAAHRAAGYQFDTRAPQIRETLTGIKRTHGTHQAAKAPAVVADLKAIIEAQRGTLAGLRDCALLLLGFAGALRRSELSSLDVEAHWTVVRGSANRRVRVLDSGGWTF
jgi:site-specific recombinase XerC